MAQTKNESWIYSGFAVPLQPHTQLGLAMLIAVDEEGHYAPVALAGTIGEARDIARCDFAGRLSLLDHGGDPGICPHEYKLWAQGADGAYRVAFAIHAASL